MIVMLCMYDDYYIQKKPLHSLDRFEKQKCPFFGGVGGIVKMMSVLLVCRWSAMFSICKPSQMVLCVLCIYIFALGKKNIQLRLCVDKRPTERIS